jgi:transposase-like protein
VARITKAAKQAFLEALEEGTTVTAAATRAGHTRWSFYRIKLGDNQQAADPEFAAAWDEAAERGEAVRNDAVRAEIQRRAVEGTEEPVFYQGEVVGHVRRYSDTLLLAMANNLLPEYDHPAQVVHTGKVDHDHVHRLDLSQLTDEELDVYERLLEKAQRPAALTAVSG